MTQKEAKTQAIIKAILGVIGNEKTWWKIREHNNWPHCALCEVFRKPPFYSCKKCPLYTEPGIKCVHSESPYHDQKAGEYNYNYAAILDRLLKWEPEEEAAPRAGIETATSTQKGRK